MAPDDMEADRQALAGHTTGYAGGGRTNHVEGPRVWREAATRVFHDMIADLGRELAMRKAGTATVGVISRS